MESAVNAKEQGSQMRSAGCASSPFGYFGSKHRIASKIANNLPPHNAWVEAFCGSAAVTLAKTPAPIEIINDIDGEIVNFFQQLRDNTDALCRAVTLTPYSRKELSAARRNFKSLTALERARRFSVSSMMAINGVFGKQRGGFSCSHSYTRGGREARVDRWYKFPERLGGVVERLRNVRIENMDARRLLKDFVDRPATLVYLDPPYLGKRTRGYEKDEITEEFHVELLSLVCKAKCMILISGYDNPLYRATLKNKDGWQTIEIGAHTRGNNGKSFSRTELLWLNSQYCEAKRIEKVPVRLSAAEKRERKVNPKR